DLVVVDRRRAVHREVSDHAPPHEVDQERRNPSLHDVSTEHRDDAALPARSTGDGVHDRIEVARRQHVWQGSDERFERPVVAWRMREFAGVDFVRTRRDRYGANGGEIRLASQSCAGGRVGGFSGGLFAAGAGVGAGVAWAGWYDLRYRLREPNFTL